MEKTWLVGSDPSSHHVFLGQVARALEPAIVGIFAPPWWKATGVAMGPRVNGVLQIRRGPMFEIALVTYLPKSGSRLLIESLAS